MVVYNKLVRDKIPGIITSQGGVARTRIATNAEYEELLRQKLGEEVDEFLAAQSSTARVAELADIIEVVLALARHDGVYAHELETTRHKKLAERGGFTQHIVLEES